MYFPSSLFNFKKSDLRKKLFLYFFTNPDRRHYLREIAELLKVDPTNLSRELRRLEGEGVFQSETSGHQKYFYLNTAYPLYEELRATVEKTIGVPAVLRGLLNRIPGIERAFIYGSLAKGTYSAHSDIDLCLVVSNAKIFESEKLLLGLKHLEKKVGREISYVFYTEHEWEKGLQKKDSFLVGLEKGPKVGLIGHERK